MYRFKNNLCLRKDLYMNNKNECKSTKMDSMRLKDIIAQLTDIIYLLCDAKEHDTTIILNQFTNLSDEERTSLNLVFSRDICP